MATKTEREILAIIKKALDVDAEITIESSANGIPEWDSLAQINIIVALDEALGGGVSEFQEMATAASARNIVHILKSKGMIKDA